MKPLRIALTKGRLEKDTIKLLEAAGFDCTAVREKGRKLILPIGGANIEVVLAKAADVITYVENGVCDLGVVGKDNRPIHFSNARITELYDFVVTVEFDYECDVLGNSKITNSTGKIDFYGSIRTANKNTTHLSLEDWDYNDWWDSFSTWNKYFDAMPK